MVWNRPHLIRFESKGTSIHRPAFFMKHFPIPFHKTHIVFLSKNFSLCCCHSCIFNQFLPLKYGSWYACLVTASSLIFWVEHMLLWSTFCLFSLTRCGVELHSVFDRGVHFICSSFKQPAGIILTQWDRNALASLQQVASPCKVTSHSYWHSQDSTYIADIMYTVPCPNWLTNDCFNAITQERLSFILMGFAAKQHPHLPWQLGLRQAS